MAEAVPDDLSVSDFGSAGGRGQLAGGRAEAAGGQSPDHLLASPGMALLAAVSILEGYKWIGAIPASDSRLSALVFGRGGALVFAALATVAVCPAPGPTRDGHRRSPRSWWSRLATAVVVSHRRALVDRPGTRPRTPSGSPTWCWPPRWPGPSSPASGGGGPAGPGARPRGGGSTDGTLPWPR